MCLKGRQEHHGARRATHAGRASTTNGLGSREAATRSHTHRQLSAAAICSWDGAVHAAPAQSGQGQRHEPEEAGSQPGEGRSCERSRGP
jgi:hypothetical protein